MIKVRVEEDFETGDKIITAIVPRGDVQKIKLDDFDRAVLSQPGETAADIFQSLEILARRQAEQAQSKKDQRQKNV